MPEMHGQTLAGKIRAVRPGVRCLFMSGYAADIILADDVIGPGVHFVQKPFSVEALAAKVAEVLAAPA